MPAKRRVLERLILPEPQAVADRYDLAVEDRRVRDRLVAADGRCPPLPDAR